MPSQSEFTPNHSYQSQTIWKLYHSLIEPDISLWKDTAKGIIEINNQSDASSREKIKDQIKNLIELSERLKSNTYYLFARIFPIDGYDEETEDKFNGLINLFRALRVDIQDSYEHVDIKSCVTPILNYDFVRLQIKIESRIAMLADKCDVEYQQQLNQTSKELSTPKPNPMRFLR